jgi:hypothetical protein
MANVLTPEFRVSFPNVFKPKKNELSGKEEYSLVALLAKGADITKLKEAVHAAIVTKWGTDKTKWPANIRMPFRDQAERAKNVEGKQVMPQGYEEGAIFINLKSAQRPGLVDQSVQDIIDESQFYAGCYARATVNAYAYDAKGNRGVSLGLVNIQKLKDGPPLGKRTRPEDDFAPVETSKNGASTADELFN